MHLEIITVIIYITALVPALARDYGQYGQVSVEIRNWVRDLRDGNGVSCCDDSEGQSLEEAQWKIEDGVYKVFIEGKWWIVPEKALITQPNKLDHATVWWYPSWSGDKMTPVIRCFLPGYLS